MAEYNNIVTKSVSVEKVARLLGTPYRSDGRLCMSDKINIWSRYKPFRRAVGYNQITFNQDVSDKYNDRDLALKAANYGLTIPGYTSNVPTLLSSYTDDLKHGWGYNAVRESDPKTMGDFINYNHRARPFVSAMSCSAGSDSGIYKVPTDGKLSFMPMLIDDRDKTQLHIGDFDEIGTPMFGILLYKSDVLYTLKGSADGIVEFDSATELGSYGTNEDFYAYPVLCDPQRRYMRLIPCCERYRIQRVSSQMAVQMRIRVDIFGDGYLVTLEVKPLSAMQLSGVATILAPDGTNQGYNIYAQQVRGGEWQMLRFGTSTIPRPMAYDPTLEGGYALYVQLNDKYEQTFQLPSKISEK